MIKLMNKNLILGILSFILLAIIICTVTFYYASKDPYTEEIKLNDKYVVKNVNEIQNQKGGKHSKDILYRYITIESSQDDIELPIRINGGKQINKGNLIEINFESSIYAKKTTNGYKINDNYMNESDDKGIKYRVIK